MSEHGNKRREQMRKNRIARLDQRIAELTAERLRVQALSKALAVEYAKAKSRRAEMADGPLDDG